jgi:hypothetical protein
MNKPNLVYLFNTINKLNTKLTKGSHREASLSQGKVVLKILAKLLHDDERLLLHSFKVKFASAIEIGKMSGTGEHLENIVLLEVHCLIFCDLYQDGVLCELIYG